MKSNSLLSGLCSLGLLLFGNLSNAQSFERVFFESGTDMNHYSIETTPAGEYVIAGTLFRGGNQDIQVMKLDAAGNLIWTVNLDETDDDRALDLCVDPDGCIVVVGYVEDVDAPGSDTDLYAVKLDPSGTMMFDRQVDGFHTAAGCNVIYSDATGSYIVGGFMGEPYAVPMIGSVSRLLELDMSLNVLNNAEFSTAENKHDNINDIVEVPGGYFITGSTAITGGASPYGSEGVLAVFVDYSFSIVADLSFESTNSEHTGVSAVYDAGTDEVWLMSNNSVIHNPQITQIEDVTSGSPFISTQYYLELDPTYGAHNAAGFKLELSPYNGSETLVAAGLYRTESDIAGNTNSAVPWITEFDRRTGFSFGAFNYPVPSPNFHTHGGGMFSTFSGEHPYFFNQELMIPRPDRLGFTLVAPIEESGNYAIDVVTTLNLSRYDAMPCFERIEYEPIEIDYDPITINDDPQSLVDWIPGYSIPDFGMEEIIYCDEIFEYRGAEQADGGQAGNGQSINMNGTTVNVSPNPVTNDAFIEIYGEELAGSTIALRNAIGQVVVQPIALSGTYYTDRVDMNQLPEGVYFLTLTNADGMVSVTKIIKR